MTRDPIVVALREVAQTKHLVQAFLLASKSIDYIAAEAVLQALDQKVRTLGKVQARLMGQCSNSDAIIAFPGCETYPRGQAKPSRHSRGRGLVKATD